MNATQLFWLILGITWAAVELMVVVKTRINFSAASHLEYRSERLIWLAVLIALGLALWVKQLHLAAFPIGLFYRQLLAVTLFATGLALRFYAVLSLGKFFSTTVITKDGHKLIETGPYQFIRHPAYTGLFICFFAAGLAMGDALALLALTCPITYVLTQRIHIEEQWLIGQFGETYTGYCLRTKKLLPWLY